MRLPPVKRRNSIPRLPPLKPLPEKKAMIQERARDSRLGLLVFA
jgi:hypothetical protein